MLYLLAQGAWFITPAMWSNMAPVWVKRVPLLDFLDKPIDGGKTLNGKPMFGRNKTYRGFVAGVVFALFIGLIQYGLSEMFPVIDRLEFYELEFADYMVLSFALGLGALVGDAVESFFKRQFEIPSGEAWVPMDQLDYVIGSLMFSLPFATLTAGEYVAAGFVAVSLHPVATFIGWKMGLKDKPI